MSITHEFRSYDIANDDWDTPSNPQDIREAMKNQDIELWLNRCEDGDWVTDRAQVIDGKLPEYMEEEGCKVPAKFHSILKRIAKS